jgi:HAMP domain-containing protein
MPEIAWYRSLYWRIALGFVALLATLLAVQGVVFLWITGRASDLLPGRSPAEYAQTIAADLVVVLRDQPTIDLDSYLNDRYTTKYRPFVVVTRDGRTVTSRAVMPPPELARGAMGRLTGDMGPSRSGRGSRGGGGGANANPDGMPPSQRPDGGRPARRSIGAAVDPDEEAVVVRPRSSYRFSSTESQWRWSLCRAKRRRFHSSCEISGFTLGAVAIGLLIAGVSIGALLIFRPTHRRLRSLQEAVQAIGAGHANARAPESGGDEVALLARSFNEMAGGLEQRSQALLQADESRRQLLADVSHELMTPLARFAATRKRWR